MENITRTVYGSHLQTCQYMKLPYIVPTMTNGQPCTLNQKFNVNANLGLNTDEIPSVAYVGIGTGALSVTAGANNTPLLSVVQHLPRDASAYGFMPFLMRTLDNDLSSQDRANYRLRVIQTFNGVAYACYYLKVLDLSIVSAQLNLITVVNGTSQTTPFVPSLSDLNPTPSALSTSGQNITTGDYISATAKVSFTMTTDDISEFLNVCTIIKGDDRDSVITEIMLCSGVDRVVTAMINGASANYTDAIVVQPTSFIATMFPAKYANTGINLSLDVGNVEPMLSVSNVG